MLEHQSRRIAQKTLAIKVLWIFFLLLGKGLILEPTLYGQNVAIDQRGITSRPIPVEQPQTQQPATPDTVQAIPVAWWQIALDRHHFSPGLIDGKYGPKTDTCVKQWQISKGFPPTGVLNEEQRKVLEIDQDPITFYTLSPSDFEQIGDVPSSWVKKAALTSLPYQSIEELLSEKFHCTPGFLQSLNPGLVFARLQPGNTLRVPRVNGRRPATFSAAQIYIGLEQYALWVLNSDREIIAYFPVSIGKKDASRLIGNWKIANHADHPSYTFDPVNYPESPEAQSIGRRLVIPPGPNSPVGLYWIGLGQGGIGIHGSPSPETIGSAESHGCFRLQNWNILKLSRLAGQDVPVFVRKRVDFVSGKSPTESAVEEEQPEEANATDASEND
jgi:lipoprotein-anchoring transpeptidase ErfK/SrfK